MTRLFLTLLLPAWVTHLTLFGPVLAEEGEGPDDRPPNFIVVFADDLGYADLGCYGARNFDTPHLDRMAAEGARLTDFYVPSSVCSASRAALLTGCYPDRVGVTGVFFPTRAKDGQASGPGDRGLHPEETTLAEVLKPAGYATACIGKWHLGDHSDFLPTQQGFDTYFGIPYSNDMGWWQGKPADFKEDFPPIPLLEDESLLEENPDQRTLTQRYTKRAVEFIREHREEPFFLYLPHTMPHVPLFVSDRFSGSAEYGLYGDVIQELDWSMGVLLRTLKKEGLEESTLVIFTSDNGPWLSKGAHGGSADPLRDGKFTRYEGGHRVPCVMRWPGRIPAGSILPGLLSTIDLLPTFAGLADVRLDPDRKIDGVDAWPYLSGEADRSPRDTFFYSPHVVRQGNWKLMMPGEYREVFPAPENPSEKGRVTYDHARLFHLSDDIGETQSLHKDSVHRDRIEAMTALCREYQEALETEARPVGRIENGTSSP